MNAIAKIKLGLNLLVAMPIAAVMAISSTSSSTVQAQIPSNSVEVTAQLPEFSVNTKLVPAEAFLAASQHQTTLFEPATVADNPQASSKAIAANPEELDNPQLQQAELELDSSVTSSPFPGTIATDANTLSQQPEPTVQQPTVQTEPKEVAQLPVPGRSTRGGSSYIGIGVNVGLSGDTVLGDGNFMIISKIGLTNALAVRPGVILGDDAVFLLPLTYEFSIRPAEALEEVFRISPYIGAGVTIATGNNDDIGLLLTGGIDVPLGPQFTGNAGLNVGIADETDIGLSLGVGYNFGGFGL